MSLGRKRMKRLREYYVFRQNMVTARLLGRKLRVLVGKEGNLLGIHDLTDGINIRPENVVWYDSRAGSNGPKMYTFTPSNYTEMSIEDMLEGVRQYFLTYLHIPARKLDAIERGEHIPLGVSTRSKYAP